MFTYLNILYRWDIWQVLAGLSWAASKIQMLISFHNLASTAQICTQKILFWITIIFDINTKHTHSCPRLLFPPSLGFNSQTVDITLFCACLLNFQLQPGIRMYCLYQGWTKCYMHKLATKSQQPSFKEKSLFGRGLLAARYYQGSYGGGSCDPLL